MAEQFEHGQEGQWQPGGSVGLLSVYARPNFGFANLDVVDEDFDLETYAKLTEANLEPSPGPMRLDPFGPKQSESPADLSNSLVFSSVMEPDPELGVDTLDEVPLELYKLSTGETVAARLGYLTGLLKDLGDMGHEDPEAEVHVENGTWRQVGTLALPSGHCLALDPRKGGRRISFQVVPGDYVAEVFEFNDADLGYFECDYGIRIRRGA